MKGSTFLTLGFFLNSLVKLHSLGFVSNLGQMTNRELLTVTFFASSLTIFQTLLTTGHASQAQQSFSQTALPLELSSLGLTDVITRAEYSNRHGWTETTVHGRLPNNQWLLAELRNGQLVEAKSEDLPVVLINALLPMTVRTARELGEFRRFTEIDHSPQGFIEVEGYDEDGRRLEAKFEPSGSLIKFKREVAGNNLPSIQEIRQSLPTLGYMTVGFVQSKGRHVKAVARAADGRWMELRISADGQITRERPWLRSDS